MGLKTEQPSLSVNALIAVARERGVERPLAPSTVHRLLSREGLLDKRPGEPVAIDRRRFAFRYAGELWMSDVMHGPKVSDGRRRRKTFLMAFIDDATRVLPFYEVDAILVGQSITLRYDPQAPASRPLQVVHDGRPVGQATRLDAYANTAVKRDRSSWHAQPDDPAPEPRPSPLAMQKLKEKN